MLMALCVKRGPVAVCHACHHRSRQIHSSVGNSLGFRLDACAARADYSSLSSQSSYSQVPRFSATVYEGFSVGRADHQSPNFKKWEWSRASISKGMIIADMDASAGMKDAARQTVDLFVKSGMVIGLGSGPASCMAIEYIGEKLSRGTLRDIQGVPMSSRSAAEAAKVGLPLTTPEAHPKLDFAFTTGDLVQEGTLYAVIGRRGVAGCESIVHEKALALAADQLVLLVEERAFVEILEGAVPVIIRQENWLDIAEEIDDCFLGDAEVWRRPSMGSAGPLGGDFPLVTKEGHFVLDVLFTSPIQDPVETAGLLESVEGVVAHGLLLDHVYAAAVGAKDGVKIRTSLFKEAFTSM